MEMTTRPTSVLEAYFAYLWGLRNAGLPDPVREYPFALPRRFRFDFAWPDERVAVEIHGATYAQGRHTRGSGFERDCEKRNLATHLGWRLYEFTKQMLEEEPDRWLGMVIEALSGDEELPFSDVTKEDDDDSNR